VTAWGADRPRSTAARARQNPAAGHTFDPPRRAKAPPPAQPGSYPWVPMKGNMAARPRQRATATVFHQLMAVERPEARAARPNPAQNCQKVRFRGPGGLGLARVVRGAADRPRSRSGHASSAQNETVDGKPTHRRAFYNYVATFGTSGDPFHG